MEWIEKIGVGVVRYMCIFMLLILTIFSIENTVFLYEASEKCYFLQDSPLYNIGVLLVVLGIVKIIQKYNSNISRYISKLELKYLLVLSVIIMCVWISISQAIPATDSYWIFDVANQLHNNSTEAFDVGGYMHRCSNQKGIVLFCYMLQFFVGAYNYVFFQFLNVIAVVIIEVCIYYLVAKWTKNTEFAKIIVGILVCFLPMILYTSFTYGTLIGLSLALVSIVYADKFFDDLKLKNALLSGIFMGLALAIKSNNLIFLIAVILVALVKIISTKKVKACMLPLALVVICALISGAVNTTLSIMTDGKSDESSLLTSAYICMGLQESHMAPGWMNGYAYTSVMDYDYDLEAAAVEVEKDLLERLTIFANDPEYAYEFFSKKIISQWCEPTFQSMWNILVRESELEETSILRYWAVAPYSGANILIRHILNYFQTIMYFGALWFCLSERKSDIRRWIGMVIVLGGFLFQIIQQAKAQYIIPYFIILIPYGCVGIVRCASQIRRYKQVEIWAAVTDKKNVSDKIIWILMLAIIMLMIIWGISFANPDDVFFYNNFMQFG